MPLAEGLYRHRADLLAVLEPSPPGAWSRPATVTGTGKPRERTVYTYAQSSANHELSHIKQIERMANTMRSRSSSKG